MLKWEGEKDGWGREGREKGLKKSIEKMEIKLSVNGEGKGTKIKRIKMCHAHVQILHNECDQYVLQTCSNKKID